MKTAALMGFALSSALFACPCMVSYSACNAARMSSLVFAGTVESIEPRFLNRWASGSRSTPALLDEIARWETDPAPQALERLKDAYLRLVPDLPEEARRDIRSAATSKDAMLAVFRALDQGVQVRFRVKTIFHVGTDDDAKDDDERAKEAMKSVVVWTDSGECGFEFMPGETYLVYASNDEQTDRYETGKCSRTKRLSDAGEDLAYLFFLKHGGPEASRLEGFVTADRRELDQDRFHYTGRIGAPVAGAVVEVKSEVASRFSETDAGGRFVLDGLAEGDYTVRAFDEGYPVWIRQAAGPMNVHVGENQCGGVVLLAAPRAKDAAP